MKRPNSVSHIKINPKINFYEARYYLKSQSLNPHLIKNSRVYNLVKTLTSRTRPSCRKGQEEICWEDFYLPLKRSGKEISIPFSVVKYKRDFFCHFFKLGDLHIKRGEKQIEKAYKKIFQEAIRFTQLTRQTKGEIIKRTVPYDFRTGRIKGKYVLNKIFTQQEKAKIEKDYSLLGAFRQLFPQGQ